MQRATVAFRPNPQDAGADYLVPRKIAQELFEQGKISIDATNGGYCPRDGVHYNMRQHRVLPSKRGARK